MLEVRNLTRRFGGRAAVDDLCFRVPDGQMVAVIGASGAGKSTLLRLLNRLDDPDGGRILHGGLDVTALRGRALRDWRRRCALVFQQFNLVPRLDVERNVLLGRLNDRAGLRGALASLAGRFTAAERATARAALARLGLAGLEGQRADTLSGGQQQRVAIARVLLQRPGLLLADEPVASLDPRSAEAVMLALRDLHAREGITVLVNLHDLGIARRHCDRVLALRRGRLVFDGAPPALTPDRLRDVYGSRDDA